MFFKKEKFLKLKTQKGSALYYAIVILSILMAMVLGLSSIISTQVKSTRTTGDSLQAFYAADSGIEEAFYKIYEENQSIGTLDFGGFLDLSGNGQKEVNEPTYDVKGSFNQIKASGFYYNTKRAIQVNF